MRNDTPPGIQIIDDIHIQPGVRTLEGRIGPLLFGEDCQSHFIDLPPGAYCDEHPHSTESIIYTVRGQWVLCSQGRRFHMRAGNLFWFGPGITTGYEVPFPDDACILIFKGQRGMENPGAMLEYLQGLRTRLETANANGTPFRFHELPADHPAKIYAKQLRVE